MRQDRFSRHRQRLRGDRSLYVIYSTGIHDVRIEGCDAYGAADTGVHPGQCTNVLALNNDVQDDVLDIETANTRDTMIRQWILARPGSCTRTPPRNGGPPDTSDGGTQPGACVGRLD